jgi:hypothetical protein
MISKSPLSCITVTGMQLEHELEVKTSSIALNHVRVALRDPGHASGGHLSEMPVSNHSSAPPARHWASGMARPQQQAPWRANFATFLVLL